jgi:hypothetical protein
MSWDDDANLLASAGYGYPASGYSGPNDPGWLASIQQFQFDNHITPVSGVMTDQTRDTAKRIAKKLQSPVDTRALKIAGGVLAGGLLTGLAIKFARESK